MDASPQAASNNVTVEYTDPSDLFPIVQPIIGNKLPLKNLHWKSPTRPVRSIESLRIGFVAAQHEAAERKSSSDTSVGPVPHRRHQIPGLRQTPYLKVYLLRCDDNDTYKNSARKTVREWIKTHASTPQSRAPSSSQEKHDAFEWLIVHVVQDGDGAEKTQTTSKWPSLSTSTVLEKIKADFNGTSKSAVDRVAQLRLPKPGTEQKPPNELPEQIEDLVEKMKNGVLASFDLRVAQYEEDIKEKDSQRSLPGWNFCTFFILKEGLARGFENVGLLEDALIGYDELSVGLDTATRDQLRGAEHHGSTFLMNSEEWKEKAKAALDSSSADTGDNPKDGDREMPSIAEIDAQDFPINSDKKAYREMILANNISVFDFRTYIFSRQLTLLLRAARAPSLVSGEAGSNQESTKEDRKPEDLMLLSEVCERSTEFIGIAARTLRLDLEHGLSDVDKPGRLDVINNIVSSWAYAATSQILCQTFTPVLSLPDSSLRAAGKKTGVSDAADAVAETRQDVPKRSSSLLGPSGPSASRPTRPASQDILPPDALTPVQPLRPGHDHQKVAPVIQTTGSEQLASRRGELFLLARRTLEEIAGRCGWTEKWNGLGLLFDEKSDGELAEVSLDDDSQDDVPESKRAFPLIGIDLPLLKSTLKSQTTFLLQYQMLTDEIFRHYVAANRTHAAEVAIADFAVLRFREADYKAAAVHFSQIAQFYGNDRWPHLEGVMLEMHARCLKELELNEEYTRVLLRLLAKFAAYLQSNLSVRQKTLDASSQFSDTAQVNQYVEDLFDVSSGLQKEVSASLTDFFADLHVAPAVLHYQDKDGFQIQLWLRFLLGKKVDIDSIKIRLVHASNSHSNEHWIETPTKVAVRSSLTKVLIDSATTLQGKYFVDRIEMRAGNIAFTFGGGKSSAFPLGLREAIESKEEDSRPYIYCHPSPEGLEANIMASHYINLEEMRSLEVELSSKRNDIKRGTIRVRPATAGLRLRIAEAKVVEGEINIISSNESGNIEFTELGPGSFVKFRIPYTVEETHPVLFAKTEVKYETEHGQFSYLSSHSIESALPISVNVQDVFKSDILFSRFTISPAMLIPLRILKFDIPVSDRYDVQSSMPGPVALNVFPKQPASLLYKIKPRSNGEAKGSLRLSIEFTCIDDECLNAVGEKFRVDIERSQFRRFSSLLTSHLVGAFRQQLSTSDMEVIGLVREIETLSYESVRWENLLTALKGSVEGLEEWLKEWHKNQHIIKLPEQPSVPSRHMVIPVDIPEIQVVHTAELRLGKKPSTHAAVGQMISAELCLRHTRRWCPAEQQENANGPLEVAYEIHANPEHWLVGGRRRGNFAAYDGESKTFAVMLLPQKPGHLLLPGVEIKTFVPAGPMQEQAAFSNPAQRRQIPSEVDYRNHGETVHVLPDLQKTTVSLGSSANGSQGGNAGTWLVDSERRTEVC